MIRSATTRRRGVVLLAVLVVIVLLALAAYQFSDLTLAEYKASEYAHRQAQARAFAEAGVHYAAAVLSNPDNLQSVVNGNPYHHPDAFANVRVPTDDKKGYPGKFTLLAPADAGDSTVSVRNGVTDETGKINLNAFMQIDPSGQVLYDALLKLPNMTDEIAASIVDWLDADNNPRMGGAENDHYAGLQPPYRAKNGPLESLEELLLVKGVSPQLLFGNDRKREGVADSGEPGATLDRGWLAYLTIHSREQLVDATGQPLVNANGTDLTKTYQDIATLAGEDMAKYVVLYRQYGTNASAGQPVQATISFGNGGQMQLSLGGAQPNDNKNNQKPVAGKLSDLPVDKLNLTKSGKTQIESFFDLIDSQVTVPGKDAKSPSVIYTSPLKDPSEARALLPLLLDKGTVRAETEIPARINVNTAPAEVLAAIPGLIDADVQSIVSTRPSLTTTEPPAEIFRTPAWLLTEASIKPATLKKLEKYITTRSQVFRVQAVGLLDGPGPSARIEAVIDVNAGRPRILAWRDLTELGK